jgi:molybdopterin-containing oxidoreductase family membrane subunit
MVLLRFAIYSLREILVGSARYYAWLAFLGLVIALGVVAYADQATHGHITANLRDPVPWGLFIGTYAFFVGVAAAAVALVVPGYVYKWTPIKEIVILGEIVAISAVIVAILFVMVDLGHPERFWHLLPGIGAPNVPNSMIGSNVLILNGYLIVNVILVTYALYCRFVDRGQNQFFVTSLMFLSIPLAISIHATTAFIFNVLPSRPYWNTAILVPRFISTALCSGPAIMLITFEVVRKVARLDIKDQALLKVAEIMTHVMAINLLLFLAEVLTEYRSATSHAVHIHYYFQGINDHVALVPFAWTGVACNLSAFFIFLIPSLRKNFLTLNIACVLVCLGVFIEKGMGLILPGLTPGTLGELYEYIPSLGEVGIGLGVLAVGALVCTVLTKVAIPLALAELRLPERGGLEGTTEPWGREARPAAY